ncbi:MAG: hypothetical protein LBN36_07040 [Clostridiales Family XIII bacterium]|jgi:hypothetical protein|nr:hypothetical protein [Clostridiales Family XIII bacterium]
MKKRICAIAIVLVMIFSMSACGSGSVSDALAQLIEGNVTGEVGKTYKTQWFSFKVESIEFVKDYKGYEPEDGYDLIDVVITETNIFDDVDPMGTFDFCVDAESFYDWIWPLDPFDPSMMPMEFDLDVDETVTYHMVYEVPEDEDDMFLQYTEWDDADNEGATFKIPIKK